MKKIERKDKRTYKKGLMKRKNRKSTKTIKTRKSRKKKEAEKSKEKIEFNTREREAKMLQWWYYEMGVGKFQILH